MIVAFTGYAGAGKSTAAKVLLATGFTHHPFTGPLKSMLMSFGLTYAELWGDRKDVPCDRLCGQTPRHAMQALGIEWGRNLIGESVWLDAWERALSSFSRPVVVDDLRFPNEYLTLAKHGALVVRIDRPGLVRDEHVSESHVDDFGHDIRFTNDGTQRDLWDAVLEWYRGLP